MKRLFLFSILTFGLMAHAQPPCNRFTGTVVDPCAVKGGQVGVTLPPATTLPLPPPLTPPYIPASIGEEEAADERVEIGVTRIDDRSPASVLPQAIK